MLFWFWFDWKDSWENSNGATKFILGDLREVSRVERKGAPITLWQPDILSVSVYYNRDRVWNEPREYFWEFLLGVCCPVLLIPTLFKIKKYISFFLTCSFGIETINTFIHSPYSLEKHTWLKTKIGKVYTRCQTKAAKKPYPMGRHIPI